MYSKVIFLLGATAALTTIPIKAQAQSWEVRREVREANREVNRERREADERIRRCTDRECVEREYRKANREVARERREARREVSREIREDYYDRFYRGNGRWWRDGRYWNRNDYLHRYYNRRDNDGADVLKGVLVGAAVAGVIVAVAEKD
jgi:hypothetical protein